MMCHRIGRWPMSTIGLGRDSVSSLNRVPMPPARITTFTTPPSWPAAVRYLSSPLCASRHALACRHAATPSDTRIESAWVVRPFRLDTDRRAHAPGDGLSERVALVHHERGRGPAPA